MSKLRRYGDLKDTCFITCVTHQRRQILIEDIDLLKSAFRNVWRHTKFDLLAHVVLPDHFHCIINPRGKDYANIVQRVKMSFGMLYRTKAGMTTGRIWQHRFWDHLIRDQDDMNRHADYIHFNPVKHGFVDRPFDWLHSSIHDDRYKGAYLTDWGFDESLSVEGEFGE